MTQNQRSEFTLEELLEEHTAELPGRDLMITISVLGIPLATIDGVNVNVDTTGPNWLATIGK